MSSHRDWGERHCWASYFGYADRWGVTFHEDVESARRGAPPFRLLAEVPGRGDIVTVRTGAAFEATGDTFWALHEPPLTVWNGFGDLPDDIEGVALVALRLLHFETLGADHGIGRAKVLEVIALSALSDLPHFAEPMDCEALDDFLRPRARVLCQGRWVHLEWDFEGDDGAWAIFRDGSDPRLIMLGEWGGDYDWFWAGNVRLTENQLRRYKEVRFRAD